LQKLTSRLAESAELHRRQVGMLQTATHSLAHAEHGMEAARVAEAERQAWLSHQHHQTVYLLASKAALAQDAVEAARAELREQRDVAAGFQAQCSRLKQDLRPWELLKSAKSPYALELARFLHDEAPLLAQQAPPHKVRIPVLALEWPPGVHLDASLCWRNLQPRGFSGLLHRLCAGELQPDDEELELTVCAFSDTRWVGALESESEAPRLAALLAYQALRLDLGAAAVCRVVPMKRSLWSGLMSIEPRQSRSTPPVGVGAVGSPKRTTASVGGAKHHQRDEVALLREVLRGCPFEQELASALGRAQRCY